MIFDEFAGVLAGTTKPKDETLGDTPTQLGELIGRTPFSQLLSEDAVKKLLFFHAADKSSDGLLQFDEFADGVSLLPGSNLLTVGGEHLTQVQLNEVGLTLGGTSSTSLRSLFCVFRSSVSCWRNVEVDPTTKAIVQPRWRHQA